MKLILETINAEGGLEHRFAIDSIVARVDPTKRLGIDVQVTGSGQETINKGLNFFLVVKKNKILISAEE